MVWVISNKSSQGVRLLIDRIIAVGKISRQEHLQLTSAILADDQVAEEERHQINRVFDSIQMGRIKIID